MPIRCSQQSMEDVEESVERVRPVIKDLLKERSVRQDVLCAGLERQSEKLRRERIHFSVDGRQEVRGERVMQEVSKTFEQFEIVMGPQVSEGRIRLISMDAVMRAVHTEHPEMQGIPARERLCLPQRGRRTRTKIGPITPRATG